jgi:hypothetical protein
MLGKLYKVRARGLEPPRIAPLVPKTNAATNYATRALYKLYLCAPSRIRTLDRLLKRELLYQLS